MFIPVTPATASYDLDKIKDRVDLLALIGGDTALRKSTVGGAAYAGPCPWCGGVDRFVVRPRGRSSGETPCWWCRQCTGEKPQSCIDYVMRRDALDLHHAAERLAEDNGISPVDDARDMAGARREREKARSEARVQDAIDRRARSVAALSDPEHGPYDGQAQGASLMVEAAALADLVTRGISLDVVIAFQLGAMHRFVGGHRCVAISIPWTVDGQTVAVQYRFLAPEVKVRYQWHPGTAGDLWNADEIGRKRDTSIVVVEGVLKALTVMSAGIDSVVAVANKQSAPRVMAEHAAALSGYERVYICLDPDARHEARAAASVLPNSRIVELPEKVDDWLVRRDGDIGALLAALRYARCP